MVRLSRLLLHVLLGVGWLGLDAGAAAAEPAARLWLHTREVRDVLVDGDDLWVASSGGLERYRLPDGARVSHFTSRDGLASHDLRRLERVDDELVVLAAGARCVRVDAPGPSSFECTARTEPPPGAALPGGERLAGFPVTARETHAAGEVVGTAGGGTWLVGPSGSRRLTPEGQVCADPVHAMARFREDLWVAGFREGLCRLSGDRFETLDPGFRMVNALQVARGRLFAATGQGLFVTRDGRLFERVPGLEQRAVTGLAVRGRYLWATTSSALWRIPLTARGRLGSYWRPGGTASLQGLAVRGRELWLASEDRGLIRFVDGQAEVYDRLSGLPTSWLLDVAVDPQGRVLGATLRDGLVVLEPGPDARLQVRQALADGWLMRVSPRARGAWIATQAGPRAWPADPGLDRALDALPRAPVHALFEHAGSLWIGSEAGLLELPLERG